MDADAQRSQPDPDDASQRLVRSRFRSLLMAIAADLIAELAFRLADLDDQQDPASIKSKVIHTVTVLTDLRDQGVARKDDAGAPQAFLEKGRGSRTWGWFSNIEDARAALARNDFDMHETVYPIAVIEAVEEGIAPVASRTEWFSFDPSA